MVEVAGSPTGSAIASPAGAHSITAPMMCLRAPPSLALRQGPQPHGGGGGIPYWLGYRLTSGGPLDYSAHDVFEGPTFASAQAGPSTTWWRWRESNPRPTVLCEFFSGCSSLRLYSAPPIMRTSRRDGPSHCECPARPRG